ncbi:LysR family transcriptional regulator [Kozakia baliensis]|uniref:LysR family transcriptional regulator n=1 Tax=Kozakia baliensis TaxID=153496 RepID=A0A1D8UYJ1_9PROT|nr:LysR family transcriptional regulator [Kozakia baliensis]AOX18682.1 LysR family transcriptional regulator [Kozakia baliensis]GEL65276.1 LysR family transcriptional regulator [Kozakia baliensis]
MGIDHINLANLDLNLLVAFDALLEMKNVTLAGKLMGIGQSAMSHNLARLRVIFGDELLTRRAGGMQRTPRAEALRLPVREALLGVQTLLGREATFDPATADRLFRIAMPDSVEMLVMPRLLADIRRSAPGIRLRIYNIDPEDVLHALDEDRIDLGIGIGPFGNAQTHHRRRLLMSDDYVTLFNPALTELKSPLSLPDFLKFPHLLTSLRSGEHGVVDRALSEIGLSRTIAVTTPRFMSVAPLVASAPVLATMHHGPGQMLADIFGLTTSPPPVVLSNVSIEMLWHASYGDDQAHRWLRMTLLDIARPTESDAVGRAN